MKITIFEKNDIVKNIYEVTHLLNPIGLGRRLKNPFFETPPSDITDGYNFVISRLPGHRVLA
jgi:hypothetical protein